MEKIIGNIIAGCLILVIAYSIGFTIFSFLFRDGKGIGLYGSRGNVYMYGDE